MKSKPFSAEERLTRYVRFLEASGGRLPELQPEARNLSFIHLYNLDVYLTVAVLLVVISYVVILVTRWLVRFVIECQGMYMPVNQKCE